MRAYEFLVERWTARTVRDYFDSQHNNRVTHKDFTVSTPFENCLMFRFRSVPDLTRAFFRMAEFYEGNRYAGSPAHDIDMADFLDNFVDRDGDVDYFRFWDGFNITDKAFYQWLKGVGKLGQAENLVVDIVKDRMKSRPFSVIGVAENNKATDQHELFHALYYLRSDYQSAVDDLMQEFRKQPAYRRMKLTLQKRLHYRDHLDEEIAAYLTGGSQLRMVFDVVPREWVRRFRSLFKDQGVYA